MINICAFVQAVVADGLPKTTASLTMGIVVNNPVKMIEWMVVVSSVLILCYLVIYRSGKREEYKNMPPSPSRWPIIGNINKLLREKLPIHVVFHSLAQKFGSVFTFWIGRAPIVVINDYALAKQVLFNKTFSGRPQRDAGKIVSRGFQGIIVTDFCPALAMRRKLGKKIWRWQSEDRLEEILRIESAYIKSSIDDRLSRSDDNILNISLEICIACCNTTWGLLFGQRINSDDKDFLKFMKMKDWLLEGLMYSNLFHGFPFIKAIPVDRFLYLEYYKKACDELIGKYYDEHRKTFDKDNIRDMIDALFLEHTQLSRDNVEIICSDFLIAGVETVASTLQFIILHLLTYKDVADKCLAELNEVVGDRELKITDVSNLHYLNAVIAETLRMRPASPMGVPHKATEDSKILDYDIPKNTILHINIYSIHYDSNLHKEPNQFRPERFLDAEGHYQNIEGFLPFSLGRRECLGKSVALKTLPFYAAEILRTYTLDVPEGHNLSGEVRMTSTLSPKPYSILLKRR